MAFAGLSLLVFLFVYCGNLKNKNAYLRLINSYVFIAYIALFALIMTIGLLVRHFGMLLGIDGMPWQFFLMALIPIAATAITYFVMTEIRDKKGR